MSYSKTYTGSVHYSGTQHYSHNYPASQSGGTVSGTVSYSGTVPVTVNLFVDTNPFDASVSHCSNSVKALNGAVVAMNSAQVASIAKSANDVSNHIVTGFFNMISSELSQNMAALFAKFKAVFELLTTQSATLEKQQVIMQDDYSRVSERYMKIFSDLDEELEKRILALDKNVVEISKRVQGEQLHSETSKRVAQFLIGVNEDEILKQQLIIANTKSKVLKAIDTLASNVVETSVYSRKINDIVTDKKCGDGEQNYIPVIYTESLNINSEMIDYNCFSNPKSANLTNRINETVKSHFVSNHVSQNVGISDKEAKNIDAAFDLLAEKEFQDLKDEKSVRVYEMLKKLKNG